MVTPIVCAAISVIASYIVNGNIIDKTGRINIIRGFDGCLLFPDEKFEHGSTCSVQKLDIDLLFDAL